jgi:hypothetical protein
MTMHYQLLVITILSVGVFIVVLAGLLNQGIGKITASKVEIMEVEEGMGPSVNNSTEIFYCGEKSDYSNLGRSDLFSGLTYCLKSFFKIKQ